MSHNLLILFYVFFCVDNILGLSSLLEKQRTKQYIVAPTTTITRLRCANDCEKSPAGSIVLFFLCSTG